MRIRTVLYHDVGRPCVVWLCLPTKCLDLGIPVGGAFSEGDRSRRIKLDRAGLSVNKAARRACKHGLWLIISLITAITFVGYFTPIRALVGDLVSLKASGWAAFWVFFFTAATYLNAGWLREKVCFHMCLMAAFNLPWSMPIRW